MHLYEYKSESSNTFAPDFWKPEFILFIQQLLLKWAF